MTLHQWLKNHPFALSLSAGYFGFFAHLGLMKVFEEEGIAPARIYGSSAGAIVGGLWASGANCSTVKDILLSIKKNDFWDPGLGFGINKGQKLHSLLEKHLSADFSELKIPFSVSAVEVPVLRSHMLTKGPLVSAVRASAAFPGMFHPVRHEGKSFLDGALLDKMGVKDRHHQEVVVCHYLLSQSIDQKLEFKRDHNRLHHHDILLVGDNFPKIGPTKLHLGEAVFDRSYQRIKKALSAKLDMQVYQAKSELPKAAGPVNKFHL